MKKSKQPCLHDHQRGEIRDNALQALLSSPLFRQRVEKKLKGKGSYVRKNNRRDWEPSLKLSQMELVIV